MGRRRRVLGVVAIAGPATFTVVWLVLGWSHHGYVPRQETISSLSAHDVPGWPWMIAGQLALGAGFVALAMLLPGALGRIGWLPAGFAYLAAYGTVQASAFRTICNHSDSGWCTPLPRSAYPHSQWLHGTGTALAFGGVLLACAATAYAASRCGPAYRDVMTWSLVAEAVALPHVVWFLANAETSWHGFAEKVFLTTLAAWVAWCGHRLARP
ncbi:MAG: DUF998 domain-containing protein [Actinomycetes bacterium]